MPTTLFTGRPARDANDQQIHFIRLEANFNDPGISVGIAKGGLPLGALIIGTDTHIQTTFNSNSTNVFSVGTNSTQYDNILPAVTGAATGLTKDTSPTGTALGPLTADATVFVKYTQTGGTAATQGKAQVVIKYALAEPGN